MTAYVIFIKEQTLDQRELDVYAQKAQGVLAEQPVTFLAAYGHTEVFEGQTPEGVVLVAFPTFEQASAWYHSDAYQAIAGHRQRGGRYRGFVVQGLD